MSRYALTPEASQDLDEIADFIARQNPRTARRTVDAIEDKCRLLATLPLMGASCEDLAPGLRRFPVGKYVSFYRPLTDGIEVVRVVHGARDIPSLFQP